MRKRSSGRDIDVPRLRRALLRWYDANSRPWPWRRDRDPYRVWVSEIMLQQTRVQVVEPAYRRFMRVFPTLRRLARAGEDDVLSLWSGLGYYSRARRLHRAARAIVASGARTFPRDRDAALALPGIGEYTAAAVLSIAYGLPYPAVDGNVERVLSRLGCLSDRAEARSLAATLLDPRRPGDWNQALMELGQTICLPRAPLCDACPLAMRCAARLDGRIEEFPLPAKRRVAERVLLRLNVISDRDGRLLLERGAFPHLVHLWLPPIRIEPSRRPARAPHGRFRHAIQHRLFDVEVDRTVLSSAALERRARRESAGIERALFAARDLSGIGRSSLLTKALRVADGGTRGVARSAPFDYPGRT